MSPLDYLLEIVQGEISKLPWPYNVLITLIGFVLVLLLAFNIKTIRERVKSHSKKLNRLLELMLFILILSLVAFFIVNAFYFPKPPEDQLVVAISPFYYIDESGQTGSDINTANDFKERLAAEKNLGIKVIMLDNPICDSKDAEFQGKKVGAHLVVYGESKKKMADIEEIIYYILPLPCLVPLEIPSEMPLLEYQTEEMGSIFITEKATFSMATEDPITIIESLKENASSAIYTIGAFENYKKSDFTSAITFFTSIKNYDSQSIILFYIANCYYSNNDLNESLQYLDKAVEINPQFARAWSNKGAALGILGKYEEAIVACDKAVEINPQFAEAWCNKGVALTILSRYEETTVAYDSATNINPQSAETWSNKGVALINLGRYEAAIAACDKAIEIKPQSAEAWSIKGVALINLGRYEEAIVAYNKAIEINPQFATTWYIKGITLGILGRYEEAIVAYNKAIEINPQFAEAWCNKGTALSDLGRFEESLVVHDKAIEINPQLVEAWYNKGNALKDLGRYEEAIAAYDKAIEITPQFTEAWNNKGNALRDLGRYEEAIAAFDKAIEINPQDAKAWYNKGIILGRLGRYEEAKEAFNRSREIDPTIEIPYIL